MVLVRRTRVQDATVANELAVPHLQNHMQSQLLRLCLQDSHCLLLLLTQRRNLPSLNKPCSRPKVIRINLHRQSILRLTLDQRNDASLHPGFLTITVDFTFTVEVPVGGGEGASYVGAVLLEVVPEGMGGDDVGFAAFQGAVQAAEADEAAAGVDVEVLAGGGAVDACVSGAG